MRNWKRCPECRQVSDHPQEACSVDCALALRARGPKTRGLDYIISDYTPAFEPAVDWQALFDRIKEQP